MRFAKTCCFVSVLLSSSALGWSSTISYTGSLANPEDLFQTTVTLSSPGTLTLQTWGFGGGTNAAGHPIAPGGFDPLVAVFTGAAATSLVNGTADDLTNYSGFAGCPPAGLIKIGNVAGNCGDIKMMLSLSAGTYTVVLTDADYIPNAIFDNGALSEGFTDLTGGSFPLQTCVDAADCNNDTPKWALDITVPTASTSVPEPGTLSFVSVALALLMSLARRKL